MKTRLLIIIGIIAASSSLLMVVSFSLYGNVNFLELGLPHTKHGQIDYVKIGYDTSLNDFKSKLDEKNIQYNSDNMTFISGMSLTSYPPHTDYCGYVMADNNDDYWYQSSFHRNTLSGNEITEENPMPCKPNVGSCICSLETKLTEITIKGLSYFTPEQEQQVGNRVQKYFETIPHLLPLSKFVVGKYNFDLGDQYTEICGAIITESDSENMIRDGISVYTYFSSAMEGPNLWDFSLSVGSEKLCAIPNNATIFEYEKSEDRK